MIFTNEKIYLLSNAILEAFKVEDNEHYIPAKLNFLIQRNKKLLTEAAIEIEKVRLDIINKYKDPDKKEKMMIPKENVKAVNQELSDLLSIEQNIPIILIDYEDLENVDFTAAQMNALMFMIDDEKLVDEDYEEDEE